MSKRIAAAAAALSAAAGISLLAPAAHAANTAGGDVIVAKADGARLHGDTLSITGAAAKVLVRDQDGSQKTGWRQGVLGAAGGSGALAVLQIPGADKDRDLVALRLTDPDWDNKGRQATFHAQRTGSTAGTPLAALNSRLDDRVDTSAGPAVLRLVAQAADDVPAGQTTFTLAPGSPTAGAGILWGPSAVDMNHDGNPDVVAVDEAFQNIRVLLGDGTGHLKDLKPQAEIGWGPRGMGVADLNHDGNPDLIATNLFGRHNGESVKVFLSDATGRFSAGTVFNDGNRAVRAVSIADVNNDGNPDFVAANFESGSVSVFLGDGTGDFTALVDRFNDVGDDPIGVTVADVNGDGNADVLTANMDSDDLSVLLGDGTGHFDLHSTLPAGQAPASVLVADLNGDGHPDIVTPNLDDDTITVMLGDGTGAFNPSGSPIAVGTRPISVRAADFNADGKPDLAIANVWSGDVTVLQGDGTGRGFRPAAGSPYRVGTPSRSIYPVGLDIADFNRDSRPDIAAATASGPVTVLLNTIQAEVKPRPAEVKPKPADVNPKPAEVKPGAAS